MMRNILLTATAASFVLAGTFGASANTSWCKKISARSCEVVATTTAPQLTSFCKHISARFCVVN